MAQTFIEDSFYGLNTNSLGAVTTSFDMREATRCAMQLIPLAGSHATFVVTMECSMDNVNWGAFSPALTQTGTAGTTFVGTSAGVQCVPRYVRARVSTVEGAVSTCIVYFQAR